MQREYRENKVTKSDNFNSIKFSVDMTADMFQMIASNLYSRPIEAIIRELSCNAWDSHVEAGREDTSLSFDVKLPNTLDNEFSIRDYGTGLTPEKIEDLYTHVFASDKTKSNSVTGCFGVGSKSPFAYTEQFTVTSYVDGKKWIYSAFLNEDLIPELADLSNGGIVTDEPNGLKVSFPVKNQDFKEFENCAKNVYYAFDKDPNILGHSEGFLLQRDYQEKGDGWGLRNVADSQYGYGYNRTRVTTLLTSSTKNYAIMGNVAYEIDPQHFGEYGSFTKFDLFFDIGELTPAASREYLQYDDKTVKNIKAKFEIIKNNILSEYQGLFKDCTTFIEALNLYDKARDKHRYNSMILDCIKDQANKFELNGNIHDLTNYSNKHLYVEKVLKDCNNTMEDKGYSKGVHYKWATNGSRRELNAGHYLNRGNYEQQQEYFFVALDQQYAKYAKVAWRAEHTGVVHYGFNTSDFKKFKENLIEFGVSESQILKVSDIERPESAIGSSTRSLATEDDKRVAYLRPFNLYAQRKSDVWHEYNEISEIPEKAYYVYRNRYDWKFEDDDSYHKDYTELTNIVRALKKIGVPEPTVVSVTESKEDLIPDGWIPFNEYLDAIFEWIEPYLAVDSGVADVWSLIYNGPKSNMWYFIDSIAKLSKIGPKSLFKDKVLNTWIEKNDNYKLSLRQTEQAHKELVVVYNRYRNKTLEIKKGKEKPEETKLYKEWLVAAKHIEEAYDMIYNNRAVVLRPYRYATTDDERKKLVKLINLCYTDSAN